MFVTQQLGQTDPVEALTTCAATPATCTNFSTVLVNLVGENVQPDRRVLELIGNAMARGPEGGTNQFYASPIAVDVIRFHADADLDFATDILSQAIEKVLRDSVTARAVDGPDGFFKHATDGIEARVLFHGDPATPADVRARAVAALQSLATSNLPSAVAQATQVLNDLGEPLISQGAVSTDTTLPGSEPAPTAASVTPVAPTGLSKTVKTALLVGFGVVAVAGIALVIGANMRPTPAPAFASGRLRRRAEAGMRRR